MRFRPDRDFRSHRFTVPLLTVFVVFATLYGFLIVNFVDSTYSPTHGLPNSNSTPVASIPSPDSNLTSSFCTYLSARNAGNLFGLLASKSDSKCGDIKGCVTMQFCTTNEGSRSGAGQSAPPPLSSLYGLWLLVIYFAPFILIGFVQREHWEVLLLLGLIVSFTNDGAWGLFHLLVSTHFQDPDDFAPQAFYNPSSTAPSTGWDCPSSDWPAGWNLTVVSCWLKNWFGFSPRFLFFQPPISQYPVTGVLMSLTLWGRIAMIAVLAYKWNSVGGVPEEGRRAKSWPEVRSAIGGLPRSFAGKVRRR